MLPNLEGQRVPDVTFRVRANNEWNDVTTDDLFAGKTVVVFSLPGAFTPTCSSTHLPRYNELAPAFKAHGVDDDRLHVGQRRVRDERVGEGPGTRRTSPSCPTATASSPTAWACWSTSRDLGFGKRSWRYSMLVKDGVIEKMFIEPEKPGDPFEVSDADTMLRLPRPERRRSPTRSRSSPAKAAASAPRRRALLTELGYDYVEIPLAHAVRSTVVGAVDRRSSTVPQVFINGEYIGGAGSSWTPGRRKAA